MSRLHAVLLAAQAGGQVRPHPLPSHTLAHCVPCPFSAPCLPAFLSFPPWMLLQDRYHPRNIRISPNIPSHALASLRSPCNPPSEHPDTIFLVASNHS
eukprot:6188503-Pleurochrysis_carterae.AAC.4